MSFRGTAELKRNLKNRQLPDDKRVGHRRADGFSADLKLCMQWGTKKIINKTTRDNIWGSVLTRDLFNVFAEPLMSASAQVSPAISNHGGVKDPAHALPRRWIVWGATKAFSRTHRACTRKYKVFGFDANEFATETRGNSFRKNVLTGQSDSSGYWEEKLHLFIEELKRGRFQIHFRMSVGQFEAFSQMLAPHATRQSSN